MTVDLCCSRPAQFTQSLLEVYSEFTRRGEWRVASGERRANNFGAGGECGDYIDCIFDEHKVFRLPDRGATELPSLLPPEPREPRPLGHLLPL